MPMIKRYPNRKLYDTEAKRYVTLEQITHMIEAGHEVQVIDNESGEDLTAPTSRGAEPLTATTVATATVSPSSSSS